MRSSLLLLIIPLLFSVTWLRDYVYHSIPDDYRNKQTAYISEGILVNKYGIPYIPESQSFIPYTDDSFITSHDIERYYKGTLGYVMSFETYMTVSGYIYFPLGFWNDIFIMMIKLLNGLKPEVPETIEDLDIDNYGSILSYIIGLVAYLFKRRKITTMSAQDLNGTVDKDLIPLFAFSEMLVRLFQIISVTIKNLLKYKLLLLRRSLFMGLLILFLYHQLDRHVMDTLEVRQVPNDQITEWLYYYEFFRINSILSLKFLSNLIFGLFIYQVTIDHVHQLFTIGLYEPYVIISDTISSIAVSEDLEFHGRFFRIDNIITVITFCTNFYITYIAPWIFLYSFIVMIVRFTFYSGRKVQFICYFFNSLISTGVVRSFKFLKKYNNIIRFEFLKLIGRSDLASNINTSRSPPLTRYEALIELFINSIMIILGSMGLYRYSPNRADPTKINIYIRTFFFIHRNTLLMMLRIRGILGTLWTLLL